MKACCSQRYTCYIPDCVQHQNNLHIGSCTECMLQYSCSFDLCSCDLTLKVLWDLHSYANSNASFQQLNQLLQPPSCFGWKSIMACMEIHD